MSYSIVARLREASVSNGGIYSAADLAILLDRSEPSRASEAVRRLVRDGLLLKVRRGLYADRLNGYRPEIAGQRWLSPAYLSTETALDRYGLCATGIAVYTYVTPRLIPRREMGARTFDGRRFVYRHLAPHLFFGYRGADGVLLASPEKAVLDFLYFAFKGQISSIVPDDIDFGSLNPRRFRDGLRPFRQRGFQAYALGFLERRRIAV